MSDKGVSSLTTAAASTAAALVGLKYLDSKHALAHDVKIGARLIPVLKEVRSKGAPGHEFTMTDVWLEAVAKHGEKTAVIFENKRSSFLDMERAATQMAWYLLEKGITTGDCVSLYMQNKTEFICWWLAITRLGAKVGLLNYSVQGKGLVHCIKVSNAKMVICDDDTEEELAAIQEQLGIQVLFWGGKYPRFAKTDLTLTYDDLLGLPLRPIDKKYRKGITFLDVFGFIYTSGTTGLPKAANIMHLKMWVMGKIFVGMGGITDQDTIYTCLPIFHSAGGGIGVSAMISSGATLVLSRKFSASRFWEEISTYNCTVFQYIGELCRYLVNYAKAHPYVYEIPHCIRLAMGNGMRPDVWDDFQDGFKIQDVLEFYGATEGNGVLVNLCSKSDVAARGCVGRQGTIVGAIMGYKIAKFDIVEEVPVRDGKTGFCVECARGESGELLMPIKEDPSKPHTKFAGYTDAKASAKKIIENAFVKGDKYFRTGDLLSQDEHGFFRFVDRIGDTFRWHGENVSTAEVAEAVGTFPGIVEANIYGVTVPGAKDGQGCCAALTVDPAKSDFSKPETRKAFFEHVKAEKLPTYARPLFLRILAHQAGQTATFKQQKMELRKQGCDPDACKPDALYWFNPQNQAYEDMTMDVHKTLGEGKVKL